MFVYWSTQCNASYLILSYLIANHIQYIINDILVELSTSGIRIEDELFKSFAYADDINLMCLKTVDLQILINICYQYSSKWRFCSDITKIIVWYKTKIPSSNIRPGILVDTK